MKSPPIAMNLVVALIAAFLCMTDTSLADQRRPLQVLDYLREQTVTNLAWSPDGTTLAYTVRRSVSEEREKPVDFNWRKARDDLKLWDINRRESSKLELPGDNLAGAWDLKWSDDGSVLSFLSDAGGAIDLWVWRRDLNGVFQVTTKGVGRRGCQWLKDTSDMICALVESESLKKPNFASGGRGAVGDGIELAREAWARAERNENTASVVDSMSFPHNAHTVYRVNVLDGSSNRIGRAYLEHFPGFDFVFKVSADGANVVIRTNAFSLFPHFVRLRGGHPGEIAVLTTNGEPVELDCPLPSDVILGSVKWSPNGRYLGFFALDGQIIHKDVIYDGSWEPHTYPNVVSRNFPGSFYIVDTMNNRIRRVALDTLDLGRQAAPPEYEWRGSNELMFYTVRRDQRLTGTNPYWITTDLGGEIIGEPNELAALSPRLVKAEDGTLFGVVHGKLVLINPEGQRSIASLNRRDISIVRVQRGQSGQGLAFEDREFKRAYWIDMKQNTVFGPFDFGRFSQFSALSEGTFAYTEITNGEERLVVSTESGDVTLETLNEHWSKVLQFEQRVFTYTSLNGYQAKGVVTFPYDYDPKKQYPTIVDSDIGYGIHGQTTTSSLYSPQEGSITGRDAATFAAAGYVHVFLSMPTDEVDDVGRANLLSFTSGILPGVDWLVREGVSDPDRLFLYGQSSMGYGVLGLITQTSRFKAAVSSIGFENPAEARDLRLSIRRRYSEAAFDAVNGGGIYLLNANDPSFAQSKVFTRNSPITYVDRVVTPLMIVAGDMDSFALSEEPFFAALVLRRVPARFVRYWGVGHGPRGVENTLDYYARVVRWFDYWGDIERDDQGQILWDRARIRSKAERTMGDLEVYRDYPLFSDQSVAN